MTERRRQFKRDKDISPTKTDGTAEDRPKPPTFHQSDISPSKPSDDRPKPPSVRLTDEDMRPKPPLHSRPENPPASSEERPKPPGVSSPQSRPKTPDFHQSDERPKIPTHNTSSTPESTKHLPRQQRLEVLKERLRNEYQQQQKESWKGKMSWLLHQIVNYTVIGVSKAWKLWENLWFKSGYMIRTIMVIVTGLFLLFFVGAFLQSGKKVVGIEDNVQVEKLTFSWKADPKTAKTLDDLYHSMKSIPFKVSGYGNIYTWYPKFGIVQENVTQGTSVLYTNQGVKKNKDGACWRELERGQYLKPDIRDILLFMRPENNWNKDEAGKITYETKKFGTLGAGKGELDMPNVKSLNEFTFTQENGVTSIFKVEELNPENEGPENIENCV